MTMDIVQTSEIYECCKDLDVRYIGIDWPALEQYWVWKQNLKKLVFACDKDASIRNDAGVRYILHTVGKAGFKYCTVPLPPSHPFFQGDVVKTAVQQRLNTFRVQYPDLYACLLEFDPLFEAVEKEQANPLLQKLIDHLRTELIDKKATVVLEDRSAVPEVRDYLKAHAPAILAFDVLSKSGIANANVCDCSIFIGASKWFPPHAFSAPRFRSAQIMMFNWIKDYHEEKGVFINPMESKKASMSLKLNPPAVSTEKTAVLSSDMIPQLDWKIVSQSILSQSAKDVKSEIVDAVLISMERDYYVFLRKDSKVQAVVPYHNGDNMVPKIPIEYLEKDNFIVLRTEGGSDLIAPIADKILGQSYGEHAPLLRESQKKWKSLLRDKVQQTSMQDVVNRLKFAGCSVADPSKVRYWISEDSIGTQQYKDFEAIMKVIGQQKKSQIHWKIAKEISQAHKRAGKIIGKVLRSKIKETQLDMLEVSGYMEFSMDEAGGGTLTVFRVKDISQETFKVPENRIGQIWAEESL